MSTAHKFQADKTTGSDVTNSQRAMNAAVMLATRKDCAPIEANFIDGIADILHLCDLRQLDARNIVKLAIRHWEEER